jgi:hypothetical protein
MNGFVIACNEEALGQGVESTGLAPPNCAAQIQVGPSADPQG